jgi:predicted PurR-regulated permease PerM
VRGVGFALGALLVLAIGLTLVNAARVIVLIFVALILAAGLEPSTNWLKGRLRVGRGASLLLVYALFFLLVLGLLVLIVPSALGQLGQFGARVGPLLENVQAWAATLQPPVLASAVGALAEAAQRIIASGPSQPQPEQVLEFGLTVAEAAIAALTVLTLVYFWLTERARLQRFALALLPAEHRAGTREAWNDVEERLGSWVRAQLILMGSVGVMTSVAYFLIGLEGALLLGVLAALAEAIPLIGPALGAIPALLVAAMTGDLTKVAIVAIVYVVIQVIEGNVLVPIVMRRTMAVPPFLVISAILIGAAVGGIIGALLAVPLVAALLAVFERLQARDTVVPAEPATSQEGVPQSAGAP